MLEGEGISVTGVTACVDSDGDYADAYAEGVRCYLSIDSLLGARRHDLKVDVYPLENVRRYLKHETATLEGAITETVLNIDDNIANMSNEDVYSDVFTLENARDPDHGLCLVYFDADTGKPLSYQGFTFTLTDKTTAFDGGLYAYEGGEMVPAENNGSDHRRFSDRANEDILYEFSLKSDSIQPAARRYGHTAQGSDLWYANLESGRSVTDPLYFVLNDTGLIDRVVLGAYHSAADAQGAEDITAQIMPKDRSTVPYGYKAVYAQDQNVYVTAFFVDGTSAIYQLYANETSDQPTQPAETAANTDMEIVGVRINGKTYYSSFYQVTNSRLDTLAQDNYQLILMLNKEPLDLTAVQPIFWTDDRGAEVYSEQTGDNVPLEGDSTDPMQDHSGEKPVRYTVKVGTSTEDYFVTLAQKDNSGPKLFVNSMPDEEGKLEREVFLVEKYEYEHNVLVANLGSKPLTNVRAELIDCTPNIKLDDYWTLNGDDIAPFTSATKGYDANDEDKYNGYLPSLAKVRIVSAGAGPIEGTLRISADDQKTVDIHLTGMAGNPQILTDPVLEAGTKNVPYSKTIATDNVWDAGNDTFTLIGGALPEGITLNAQTGELRGTPQETGTYTFTVRVDFARSDLFTPVEKEFTLTIREDENASGGGSPGGGPSDSGSSESGGTSGGVPSGGDSGSSSASSGGGAAPSAPAASEPQYATLTLRVTDANGNGLPGVTVELHSEPRIGVTDANGYVTFRDVPFGTHTLYVKDASGQIVASCSFVFEGGAAGGVSGDSVLARPGGAIALTVRLNGRTLSIVSASSVIPQTADPFDPARWTAVLLLSAGALALLAVYKKRRRVDRGDPAQI